MHKKTPYYSKQMNWQKAGFPSEQEFNDWNPDICGIYCLKMAGDILGKTRNVSVWQLLNTCQKYKGFKEVKGERIGVFHKSLVKTANYYGLSGKVIKHMTSKKIKELLNKENLIILSIDKNKVNAGMTGGHLILITEHDEETGIFTINDPDPILAEDGQSIKISEANLQKISNRKGINLLTNAN